MKNIILARFFLLATVAALAGTLIYLLSPMSAHEEWFMDINILEKLKSKKTDEGLWVILGVISMFSILITLGRAKSMFRGINGWIMAILLLFISSLYMRPILASSVLIFMTTAMGRFFLRNTGILKRLYDKEMPVVFFSIGIAGLVLEIHILSSFSSLSFWPIIAVTVIKALVVKDDIIAIWIYMKSKFAFYRAELRRPITQLMFMMLIAFLAVSLICALVPPFLYDEISYHMAFPKVYAQMQRVPFSLNMDLSSDGTFTPFYFGAVLITNVECIFAYLYAIAGPISIRIFQVMCLVITSFGIIEIATHRGQFRAGLIGALLLVSFPLQNLMAATSYIEIELSVFTISALELFFYYIEDRRLSWMFPLGIIVGLALGTKLSMLILFCIVLACMFILFACTKGRIAIFFHAIAFSFVAIFICAPWFWRNFEATGNPTFPVNTKYFAEKIQSIGSSTPTILTSADREPSKNPIASMIKPARYILDITFRGQPTGYYQSPEGSMGFLFFITAPLAFLLPLLRRREWKYLSLICVILLFCIPSLDRVRYALPFFPPLCLAIGLGAMAGLNTLNPANRNYSLITISVLSMINIFYMPCDWSLRKIPINYLTASIPDSDFYKKSSWKTKYEVIEVVNKHIRSRNDRVMEIGWSLVCPYFCEGVFISLTPPGSFGGSNGEYFEFLYASRGGNEEAVNAYANFLKDKSIKLLVVPDDNMTSGEKRPDTDVDRTRILKGTNYAFSGLGYLRTSARFEVVDRIHGYSIIKVMSVPPEIIDYGPKFTQTVEQNSNQTIAMWFKTANTKHNLKIVFSGEPLATHKTGDLVSAVIPSRLLEQPGEREVWLLDESDSVETKPIIFKINEDPEIQKIKRLEKLKTITSSLESALLPPIKSYGPRFCTPQDISSTSPLNVWFETQLTTGTLFVVFDGTLLDSVRSDTLITASIPTSLITKPGTYEMFLFDECTNGRTPSVPFAFAFADSPTTSALHNVAPLPSFLEFGPKYVDISNLNDQEPFTMWFRIDPIPGSLMIIMDGVPLNSARNETLMSASIPKSQLKLGNHNIWLLEQTTGARSPSVVLEVLETASTPR